MPTNRSESIVLFVDVLGFADLVMSLDSAAAPIESAGCMAMSKEVLRQYCDAWNNDPLTRTFIGFHRLLDLQIESMIEADPEAVVFSDSAYVSFRDAFFATWFASRFM